MTSDSKSSKGLKLAFFTSTCAFADAERRKQYDSLGISRDVALPIADNGFVLPTAFKLSNGKSIPSTGLGTWGGGDDAKLVSKAVETALKLGYRHIDCAEK